MKKVIRAGTAEAAMVELLRKLKAMGYSPENLTVESGTASLKKHALRKLKMFFLPECPWVNLRRVLSGSRFRTLFPTELPNDPSKRRDSLRLEMVGRDLAREQLSRLDVLQEVCCALLADKHFPTSPAETIARLEAVASGAYREAEPPCAGCLFLATDRAASRDPAQRPGVRKPRSGDRRA